MTPERSCGSCGLCCKLMHIDELDKPENSWCPHYRQGGGCGIYRDRPAECASFVCGWLANPALDDRWKPSTARFFLWQQAGARRMIVEVDPAFPQAWRREPYYSALKTWARRDRPGAAEILVKVGRRVTMIFPEADIELGIMGDRPLRSGYAFRNGRYEPYARFE